MYVGSPTTLNLKQEKKMVIPTLDLLQRALSMNVHSSSRRIDGDDGYNSTEDEWRRSVSLNDAGKYVERSCHEHEEAEFDVLEVNTDEEDNDIDNDNLHITGTTRRPTTSNDVFMTTSEELEEGRKTPISSSNTRAPSPSTTGSSLSTHRSNRIDLQLSCSSSRASSSRKHLSIQGLRDLERHEREREAVTGAGTTATTTTTSISEDASECDSLVDSGEDISPSSSIASPISVRSQPTNADDDVGTGKHMSCDEFLANLRACKQRTEQLRTGRRLEEYQHSSSSCTSTSNTAKHQSNCNKAGFSSTRSTPAAVRCSSRRRREKEIMSSSQGGRSSASTIAPGGSGGNSNVSTAEKRRNSVGTRNVQWTPEKKYRNSATPLWYFGFGSNVNPEKMKQARKLRPLASAARAVLPDYSLTFTHSVYGYGTVIPRTEFDRRASSYEAISSASSKSLSESTPSPTPSSASNFSTNISTPALSTTTTPSPDRASEAETPNKSSTTNPREVHGALWLLSPADFDILVQSEYFYDVIEVEVQVYAEDADLVTQVEKSHNLVYNQRGQESSSAWKTVRALTFVTSRHVPEARAAPGTRPTARYISLISDGAQEIGLRGSYCNWLQTIKPCDRSQYS
ncbi:unnamed protein product [Amoebophrya sp. A25]|nr:unnamed protein product [Amoebophrya sp. A25]|eukprot:GSA25T00018944001.1